MRYSICLSYNGADFCGWQIQPSAPSVQAALEGALSRLLGGPVAVTGAGRTDTAVNAVGYIAHFDFGGPLPFETSDFIYKLNAILPRSVVVHEVIPVPDDFHARFGARRREYTYFIHRQKDPFVAPWSWQCGYPVLDFDAMNEACKYLLGTHDFSCFEKTGTDNKTSICTVFDAFWKPYTPSHIQVMGSEAGGTGAGACAPPHKGRGRGPLTEGTDGSLLPIRHLWQWEGPEGAKRPESPGGVFRAISKSAGSRRAHSSSIEGRGAPGRVLQAPMSITSAPSESI